jgi:hypothetical protein
VGGDGERRRLVSRLPEHGIWTAVGLTRDQFLVIVALATFLFVCIGGPVWRHLRESHFDRIAVSYLVIPVLVGGALYRNGRLRLLLLLEATFVVAVVKLVVTAALLIMVALAT